MAADLQSPSFSTIGVDSNVVQQTIQSNQIVTKKTPHGYMAADKYARLYILLQVVV